MSRLRADELDEFLKRTERERGRAVRRYMNEIQCCGACRFHRKMDGDWVCCCEDAEEYSLETGYSWGKGCDNFEER